MDMEDVSVRLRFLIPLFVFSSGFGKSANWVTFAQQNQNELAAVV